MIQKKSVSVLNSFLGLRTKIALPLTALALLLSVAGIQIIHRTQTHQRQRNLLDRAKSVASTLSLAVDSAGKPVDLQEFVTCLGGESDMQDILVVAGNPPTIIASANPQWIGLTVDDVPSISPLWSYFDQAMGSDRSKPEILLGRNDSLFYSSPIDLRDPHGVAANGQNSGVAILHLDGGTHYREQAFYTLVLMGSLAGAIGLAGLVTYVLLRQVVLQPMKRISRVVEATAKGDRTARVGNSDFDEIGELARNFDAMLEELAEREHQFRTLVNNIPGVSYRCLADATRTMLFVSNAVEKVTGLSPDGFVGNCQQSFASLIHPDDWERVEIEIMLAIAEERTFEIEYRIFDANGDVHFLWERGQAVYANKKTLEVRHLDGAIFDITARKKVEKRLIRSAKLDALTGLPNRAFLLQRLQTSIRKSQTNPDTAYALLFLDFDRFKLVNDSWGHEAGDRLLKQIAGRLKLYLGTLERLSDEPVRHTAARLGGDEFVVLLDGIHDSDDACRTANELLSVFSQAFDVGKNEVHSSASIGIVVGNSCYSLAKDVLRDADIAMYEAKRLGRGRYVLFDSSMHDRVERRMRLENDLRRAIENRQLSLAYQPVMALAKRELVAVEALVRWTHPTDGPLNPSEFVGIAEESDLILALGEFVLREGCQQFAKWQRELGAAIAPPIVSINLSRKQFIRQDLPGLIRSALADAGMRPNQLQIEITEDAFMCEESAAISVMKCLKQLGIRLAIDDFGKGQSSLVALHKFPVDVLKSDRELLLGIEESTDVAALLHALAVLSKNLDIILVAEGVETQQQAEALKEVGCEFAQGYLFSRPLTADDLAEFVRGQKRAPRLALKSGPIVPFFHSQESTQALN